MDTEKRNVRIVSCDEIKNLYRKLDEKTPEISNLKARILLGLFTDDCLESVAVFGTPTSEKCQDLTRELNFFVALKNPEMNLEELVEYYLVNFRPHDFAMNSKKLNIDSTVYSTDTNGIYRWSNPDHTFYCYRITSVLDDFYYIGRHTLQAANSSKEELLNDGYYGSGGIAFKEWVKRVGLENLQKEILGIYPTHAEMVTAERELIGGKFRTDGFCLNAQAGGSFSPKNVTENAVCSVHGLTLHGNGRCYKCRVIPAQELECPIHGSSNHTKNGFCLKCLSDKQVATKECPKHGITIHRHGRCATCNARDSLSQKECEIHGLTMHIGNTCLKCSVNIQVKECHIHGLVKFSGDTCATCTSLSSFNERECPKHGLTKHQKDHCLKCRVEKTTTLQICPTHGETIHQGSTCGKCTSEKIIKTLECKIHGVTPHFGVKCAKCASEEKFSERECPIHGITRHTGNLCLKCKGKTMVTEMECPKHGLAKFRYGICYKCSTEKMYSEKECKKHGLTKHRRETCTKCTSEKVQRTRLENLKKKSDENIQPLQ